jgi:hypothetical protein
MPGWNHDGSRDVGLMQINSHILVSYSGRGLMSIAYYRALYLHYGRRIYFVGMIKVYGYNWEAVGAYNAGLKKKIIRSA